MSSGLDLDHGIANTNHNHGSHDHQHGRGPEDTSCPSKNQQPSEGFLQKRRKFFAILSAIILMATIISVIVVVVYYAKKAVDSKVEELKEYAPVDVEDPESGHREKPSADVSSPRLTAMSFDRGGASSPENASKFDRSSRLAAYGGSCASASTFGAASISSRSCMPCLESPETTMMSNGARGVPSPIPDDDDVLMVANSHLHRLHCHHHEGDQQNTTGFSNMVAYYQQTGQPGPSSHHGGPSQLGSLPAAPAGVHPRSYSHLHQYHPAVQHGSTVPGYHHYSPENYPSLQVEPPLQAAAGQPVVLNRRRRHPFDQTPASVLMPPPMAPHEFIQPVVAATTAHQPHIYHPVRHPPTHHVPVSQCLASNTSSIASASVLSANRHHHYPNSHHRHHSATSSGASDITSVSRSGRRLRQMASASRRQSRNYHNSSPSESCQHHKNGHHGIVPGSSSQDQSQEDCEVAYKNPATVTNGQNHMPGPMKDLCGGHCPCQPRAPKRNVIHWFRRGLRFHDNPSLRSALKGCASWRCVYVLDPWFAGASNVGINKWRFLLESLEDLDRTLRKMNSRLYVIRGQPANVFPKLFRDWKVTKLTFEDDPEPFGKVRDQKIKTICKEMNISVTCKVSHTLYRLQKIIDKNHGQAPITYRQFHSVLSQMEAPAQPAGTVNAEFLERFCPKAVSPVEEDHDDRYGIPTLEELGFETHGLKQSMWPGGETEAMCRLERHLERRAWVASFGRPRMTPQSLMANQTGLNPYLRFGCLSPKTFYHQMSELYRKIKKSQPPLSLHGQLLWREFFYCAATNNPKFDKMEGNPICVQIPWAKNPAALAKWANGQTGYPWIDAIMTQLREEGWIHQLARHAVACFLTRGDLWLSWEEGTKVFEELLLEADWSVNAGSWMWLSCSSFFQQFFHSYCPVKFGRKVDPNGDYIRKYLPVLKNFPTKFIHEPWKAPESVQKQAKCVIGKEYPLPMVNHSEVSKINVERIRQVYQRLSSFRNGHGSTPERTAFVSQHQPMHLLATTEASTMAMVPLPLDSNGSEMEDHLISGLVPMVAVPVTTTFLPMTTDVNGMPALMPMTTVPWVTSATPIFTPAVATATTHTPTTPTLTTALAAPPNSTPS